LEGMMGNPFPRRCLFSSSVFTEKSMPPTRTNL
jgi:hypothetical protein